MDSSFSLNSPDDDVSPSNFVKLQFEARNYDEIFAGSFTSSIPEINVSYMRERVGLGGARGTENVEYASIFSGFDDNDVAMPYEEFSGTGENKIAKQKTKAPISIGVQSMRESSSQHPPKNARFSNKGSSDQPIHDYRNKQRISVSLNQISPRDYGESNGKAHIEQQAHAVPGFTYSVNGNTQPENAQGENCATSLQRDVSRTWSFSAEVESVKAKEGKCSPSHLIDQSYNMDEGRSRISDFHSKDASERISADLSFPFFDEELNGNSSAAALKKAIEQAQECIRLAKRTVERKRGLQDEPKTDSPINVLYEKKASDEHGDDHHKENNASFDPVIPMFSKVDDKFAPAFCSSEELFYAEEDVLDLEKTKKMSGLTMGLKENCNAYVKSCDDENNKVLDEEDEEWFESEVQLKEEEISENEPKIYLEVELDALRPNRYSERDVQKPPGDPKLNETTESRMGTFEREAIYDKIKLTADFQKVDPKNDKFGLSEEVSETQDNDQFHKYCEKSNGEAIDDSVCEARSDETNFYSCKIQEPGCDGLYHKAEKSHGATESFPITNKKEAGKKVDLEPNENAETGSFRKSASELNLIGNSLHCSFPRNVGFADEKPEEMFEHVEEFNTNNEVCCPDESVAANIYRENLPDDLPSSTEAAEYDLISNERHDLEQTSESEEGFGSNSNIENIDGFSTHESREHTENEMGNCSDKDEVHGDLNATSGDKEHIEEKSRKLSPDDASEAEYSHLKEEPKEIEKSPETQPELETCQNTEKNKVNPITKEDNAGGYDADDVKQRIEAIKRGRERQKEQIAVERAIREARERAFVDAQQRAMAEAQWKVEREGRAAVERATAEARERALQKAMSMKNSEDARTKDDAHPMERFSSSSRNNGLKHSFSSSDLDKFDRTCSESAQRRKARLEREQRIRERVDKALAEKNKRDRVVQKEQAERNRLSASLDAEIKRWSSGKEGNLRALLSTLQYILGPKSGWQPISPTEMITAAAVKKAYRKATLYVHPDKLQQRGATVRQKYVCEKVFDLLKAAWSRFNSEER